ncbi:MAG: hypothetical protein K940chlam2_00484 [Chlamydiae bacterium]|nr:hypothetical protein [Chlamydiota bacterium]
MAQEGEEVCQSRSRPLNSIFVRCRAQYGEHVKKMQKAWILRLLRASRVIDSNFLWQKQFCIGLLWLTYVSPTAFLFADPIPAGKAFFQVENIDGNTGKTDATYYPLVPAPDKVSVTTTSQNPQAPLPPFRVHSWVGGAMLWATGQLQTDVRDGYFVAKNVPPSNIWPAELFQQAPVIADPMILEYMESPNKKDSDPTSRGINLCFPYPFYKTDTPYGAECQTADPLWETTPIFLETDSQLNILVFPSDTKPVDGVASGSVWDPKAILVDRIGDWGVDLIFQNKNSPYGTPNAMNPDGRGEYIKCTIVQGCPYVFFECRGIEFIGISNRMIGDKSSGLIAPATTAAAVPGVSNVDYARFGGNQNNPAIFTDTDTLNPPGLQDNFTTWAVYFKNDLGIVFDPGSVTTQPQNSSLEFPNKTDRFFFAIAGIPTIYAYPTDSKSYATVIGESGNDVDAYAKELGKYAFNFITDTKISYTLKELTFLETTFSPTLTNPYDDSTMVAADSTVMCLMPHHYQSQKFDTGLVPTVLDLDGSTNFSPTGTGNLFYWSVRGNLKAILGDSFKTNYVFTNFLPTMPPPFWTDQVTTAIGDTSIGQLLFDSIDNEYINNLSDKAFAPWNTAYFSENKGIYDIGKTLAKDAKQLGLVLEFLQGLEENGQTTDPFHEFFFQTLIEQQYNNRTDLPDRPGAFNPPESKPRVQSLRDALKSSVIGDPATNPPLAGVEGAISPYFGENPSVTRGGFNLSHYAFYDPIAHLVMLYPSAGDPGVDRVNPAPWPGRINHPPIHQGAGVVWESFGVANAFNDHHYQYGYWISAAGLATQYDGAWKATPDTGNQWGAKQNFGEAIDQLVQDIVYDPDIDAAFFKNPNMDFAKLNFFDQWAGHGWADGVLATISGGNAGHNENSIGEALQAYASIILWGMATQREDIVALGVYLYTTTSYAMDAYFFDKNLNLKKGQSPTTSFVPLTTKTGDATYPDGSAFIDFTIHSTTGGGPISSGTPKIAQAKISYATDFGETPENIKLINAFPCSAWSLVMGRNKDYLNAWNASMDTAAFVATIPASLTVDTNCWKRAFDSNMNMLRSLGGNTIAFGQTDLTPSAPTPFQFMLDVFTRWGKTPPWGSIGGAFTDPSQSINEVLHFMHVIDHFGTPDWTVYGHAVPNTKEFVYTASFTKGGTTTFFAFNPNLTSIDVQFFKLDGSTPSGLLPTPLTVMPKRWASAELP